MLLRSLGVTLLLVAAVSGLIALADESPSATGAEPAESTVELPVVGVTDAVEGSGTRYRRGQVRVNRCDRRRSALRRVIVTACRVQVLWGDVPVAAIKRAVSRRIRSRGVPVRPGLISVVPRSATAGGRAWRMVLPGVYSALAQSP